MQTFKFDKEKYLKILKSEGVNAALTLLQQDTIQWEHEAFEGQQGYSPKMWSELEKVRSFSREIWEIALKNVSGNIH